MVPDDEKIDAAIEAVEGERLRWLLGKKRMITEETNVFGHAVNEGRYNTILENVAQEELERALILRQLAHGPGTVHEISHKTGLSKTAVVDHLIALKKWRKVEDAGQRDRSLLWRLAGKC